MSDTNLPNNDGTVHTKKKGKKRKVSKHITDSMMKNKSLSNGSDGINESTDQDGTSNVAIMQSPATTPSTTTSKKQKLTNQKHMKDPVDVEGYLLSWKQQHQDQMSTNVSTRSNGSKTVWKFNKNTQSWLIRHLYDSSKINKSIFAIALQYFEKSNVNVQQRLRHDATQRAIQYQQQHEKETTQEKDKNNNDDGNKDDEQNEHNLPEKNQRKEYKRARKMLDTLSIAAGLNATGISDNGTRTTTAPTLSKEQ